MPAGTPLLATGDSGTRALPAGLADFSAIPTSRHHFFSRFRVFTWSAFPSGSRATRPRKADTSFENASPLSYDFDANGTVRLHLLVRSRAIVSKPSGRSLSFSNPRHSRFSIRTRAHEFGQCVEWTCRLDCYELKTAVISTDGTHWKPAPLQTVDGNRVRVTFEMSGPKLYVARVEPYRVSDLERLLGSLGTNPMVQIDIIGKTVQGCPIELLRLGNPQAPHRVFLRARAHAWEAGSSWVVEGFIRRFLADDDLAKACREGIALCFADGEQRRRGQWPHTV